MNTQVLITSITMIAIAIITIVTTLIVNLG